ncbi:AHH domain-containing protein [Xanthomonas sp. NCPPB 1067]|nr:AHH domain-containing protein [Xanthomonas sp. NCPPB 1067]MCC4589454.1 AHH domain-containing protein [Xanthomonas sp. NCPPB 1067]
MSEENRRNVANTIAGATQIVGLIVSPKTSLLPGTGGLGVPRAPVPRYVQEVSPNTLVIPPKNPVASNGYGVPREPVPRSVEEAPPNATITNPKNPTASRGTEVPPNQPIEQPAFSSSRPLALPSPNFNVPSGYTASKNADGTATVTGPRGGIYNSTGRYTDDGKPIFRDNNGGYVTLEGGRVSVRAPTNYDTIPIHHICTDKCNSDTNGREAWTPQFQRFFDGSGLDIKRAKENLVAVPGHRGPHPDDYHRYVYGMLDDATSGLTPKDGLINAAGERSKPHPPR